MMRVLGIDQSLVGHGSLRHGVVTARRERMAAKQPPQPEPSAAHDPMPLDRRVRIARARGIEPTARPEQRTQCQLVEADDRHQDLTHGSTILGQCSSNVCSDWHEGRWCRRAARRHALQL
jgi:hypothetical protein